jgi:putative peptide zinc metalloprotease protein
MNRVLGITLSANPATTRREATIFTIYGIAAVAYRVFLCVAIVVGVYYRFDKLVGIILGGLAGILFLVRPMIRGVKRLYNHRREIHLRPVGGVVFFLVVAALVTVLVIPVTTRAIYPCYLASAKTQKLTVPLETSVATVFIRHGMTVEEGMLLFQLEPTRLDLTVAKKSLERDIVKQQVQLMLLDQQEMAKAGEKQIELALLEKEIALRKKDLDLAQKGIRAPFSGVVTKFDYRLQHGFQPGEGAIVGELASQRDCEVRILVPEEEIDRVRLGAEIEVWFPSGAGYFIAARIQEMRPYSERDLKDSPFSSRLGGEIATEAKDTEHADAPLRAQYVCSAKVQNDKLLALGMTGRCAVLSPPQSILSRLIYSAVQALNRESIL